MQLLIINIQFNNILMSNQITKQRINELNLSILSNLSSSHEEQGDSILQQGDSR